MLRELHDLSAAFQFRAFGRTTIVLPPRDYASAWRELAMMASAPRAPIPDCFHVFGIEFRPGIELTYVDMNYRELLPGKIEQPA